MTKRRLEDGKESEGADLLHPRSIPPFASLRAFEAVGRVGGIRKAAAILSIDHAVVSRHIRTLEEWLGVPLMDRTGGRLELTPAGRKFHRRVCGSFVELASATADVRGQTSDDSVRLWSVPGLAYHWLSESLAEFGKAHPDITVELRPSDQTPDFAMMEADADIRFYGDGWHTVTHDRHLRSFELARPSTFPVATPLVASSLLAAKSASALLECPLLHEENQHEWKSWFAQNRIPTLAELPGALHWHAHLAIAAARQGRGIALANNLLVGRDLREGTLVKITLPDARPVNLGAYVLVARADRWQARSIATLRKFLHARAISSQSEQ